MKRSIALFGEKQQTSQLHCDIQMKVKWLVFVQDSLMYDVVSHSPSPDFSCGEVSRPYSLAGSNRHRTEEGIAS